MENLNLLELSNVQLNGGYINFPKAVKWLVWQGCPLELIPEDLELYELAVLDMQNSHLSKAWEKNKLLGGLRILNLSHSRRLRTTPDFSNASELEWIILEGCVSLVKIHESIGSLRKLTYLNLNGCKNLGRLPSTIEKLHSIKKVELSRCPHLFSIPDHMESSIILASGSNQKLYPFSSLKLFASIVDLSLSHCGISRDTVFDSLSCLSSLERLDLGYNPFTEIKKDLGAFTRLHILFLGGCRNLKIILQLPGSLNLSAGECPSLERVEYQQNPYLKGAGVSTFDCPILVEIEGVLRLEPTTELDSATAKYMGFSKLESSPPPSSNQIAGGYVDYGLSKGAYQCGIYSVFLEGDHIVEDWFTVTELGSEIVYTDPCLSDHPIRAFNVGCVYEFTVYGYGMLQLQIENLTSMSKWLYIPAVYPCYTDRIQGNKVTWLSHWSVMLHRDVRHGDVLKVSFKFLAMVPLKCGINIIYEVDEEDVDSSRSSCLASTYHHTFRSIDLSGFAKQDEPGSYTFGIGVDMCTPLPFKFTQQ